MATQTTTRDSFDSHDGHTNGDGFNYVDLNQIHDGENWHSVDHVVTQSGTVMVRVDGTYLSKLPQGNEGVKYEDGGYPAPGF